MNKQLEALSLEQLDTTTGGVTARWIENHPFRGERFLENHPGRDAMFTANHPYAAARLQRITGF